MLTEVVVFIAVMFVVAVVLLWRSRSGGTGEVPPTPATSADRPEPTISSESSLGPHRNVGRPWHVDQGERPSADEGEGI